MKRALLFASLLACSGSSNRIEPIESFPPDELDDLDATPDPTCTSNWIIGGRGKIVDERGNPIAGARPQLCLRLVGDELLCLMPPESSVDGFWHQAIEGDARCINEIALRALLPSSNFATTYCHAPLTLQDGVLEMRDPIILYDLVGGSIPPEGDPDVAREVVFDDGLMLSVTPSVLFGDNYISLAARRVSLDDPPCFVEGAELLGLFAFGPEASTLGSGAGFPLRIRGDHGLAEGTRIELLILGGLETVLPDDRFIGEADFEVYGTATVRGGDIVSDEGSGLPYLSWLGYRVAP